MSIIPNLATKPGGKPVVSPSVPLVDPIIPDKPRAPGNTTPGNLDPGPRNTNIVDVGTLYPPASKVNEAAKPVERTLQAISAVDQIIPVLYGYPIYLGVRVAGIVEGSGNLHLLGVLGYGPISRVQEIYVDDRVVNPAVPAARYYGTQAQTVDTVIQAAYATKGVTFTDAMRGIAYVRLTLTPDMDLQATPNIVVQCGGKEILDVRTGATADQNNDSNPALCLADFISNAVYGMGANYDTASFAAAADFCDETTTGGARYRIALALTSANKVDEWLTQLTAYTGCVLWRKGGVYHLTPLRARASSITVTKSNMVTDSFDLNLRAQRELPTRVSVEYTDWQTRPPSTRVASQENAGASGSEERESKLSLPGVTDYSMASRIAGRRLNAIWYGQLTASWRAFDAALDYNPGDVLTLTFPEYGLNAAKFWITGLQDQGFGRWSINAESYADAAFTDTALPPPPVVDPGDLVPPSNVAPTFPGPVAIAEELVEFGNGDFRPRVRVTWAPVVDITGLAFYSVQIIDVTNPAAPVVIETGNTPLNEFVSSAVTENRIYHASVYAVGINGLASSPVLSPDLLVLGKTAPPQDVSNFTCVEAGGNVYVSWAPITDPDRDEYEIRRGAVGVPWASMVLVSKLHATNTVLNSQPMGTVDYAIKARDTSGNYSAIEARQTVTVTQDQNLNITGPNPFIGYTTSNCVLLPTPGGVVMMNTNLAGMWGDGADNPDDTVGTFDDNLKDIVIARPADAPAWMQSNPYDFTVPINTRVSCSAVWWNWGGPSSGVTMTVETSLDNVTYTPITEIELRTVRYVRCRLDIAAGTCIQSVQNWTVSLVSILVTEQGNVTTDASGKATVNLSSKYSTWVAIQTTPLGNVAGVTSTFDNVRVGTGVTPNAFDVWIFKANAPAAGTASWSFRGVR